MTVSAELAALQEQSFARAQPTTRGAYPPDRRLSADALGAMMTVRKYIVVGTVNRSGRPHVAPSSFVWWAAQVWLPTESGAARVRHLRSSPFVSLALTEGEDRHHAAVLMEGPAELTTIEDAPEDPGRLWEAKFSHAPEWADVWICARPERLFSYAAEDWMAPPIY